MHSTPGHPHNVRDSGTPARAATGRPGAPGNTKGHGSTNVTKAHPGGSAGGFHSMRGTSQSPKRSAITRSGHHGRDGHHGGW